MKVLIAGGTGFVGSNLSAFFLGRGYRVIAVGRSPRPDKIAHENYQYISADTTQAGAWQEALEDVDVVVNLAGASIFKRWSDRYKKQIYDSRILTTRNVVAALPEGKNIILCSASGAGYYGSRGDDILKEDEPPGRDFLANVSVDWEKEAFQAQAKQVRVVVMRFGVVLGKNGGAMQKMIPAYKSFVGGPIGSGQQWFPWIHLDDLMAAVQFIINQKTLQGPTNFCAPDPVRNRELAKTLGDILNRPAFMPAPAFMIRMLLGEFGGVLLDSQRVIPGKLLSCGYAFQYPDIRSAIQAIVK